jgi:hypothetical protein
MASYILGLIFSSAPLVAIVLASRRLVVNNYGDAGGDAANAAKLKASLQIFYCLALAQNILILCVWGSLFLDTKGWRASAVSRQCGFGEKWGARLVRRYHTEGRNLVTFAVTFQPE